MSSWWCEITLKWFSFSSEGSLCYWWSVQGFHLGWLLDINKAVVFASNFTLVLGEWWDALELDFMVAISSAGVLLINILGSWVYFYFNKQIKEV